MIGNDFRVPFTCRRCHRATVAVLGAGQRLTQSGRQRTNGCVERVEGTILQECWKPALARHLIRMQSRLIRDLDG